MLPASLASPVEPKPSTVKLIFAVPAFNTVAAAIVIFAAPARRSATTAPTSLAIITIAPLLVVIF